MSKSVFDLTLEELTAIGQRASADAIRRAQEAGIPIATMESLAASNVTPLKAKRAAVKAPAKRVAAAGRARKGA